jgi:hypothetical protein
VRDTGIGIPASLLTRIFDMFSQGDSLAGRSESGLGIGLTIAKSLVELHGGTIEARSDGPGRGAEFAVRLPLIAAEEVPAGTITEAPLAPPFRGMPSHRRDNRDAGDSLALILRREGMGAQIATDGEAGSGDCGIPAGVVSSCPRHRDAREWTGYAGRAGSGSGRSSTA